MTRDGADDRADAASTPPTRKQEMKDRTMVPQKAAGDTASLAGVHDGQFDRVSNSLKKVYEATINESVPDEMLELLKKLG